MNAFLYLLLWILDSVEWDLKDAVRDVNGTCGLVDCVGGGKGEGKGGKDG